MVRVHADVTTEYSEFASFLISVLIKITVQQCKPLKLPGFCSFCS